MLLIALLLAATSAVPAPQTAPACRQSQLRLTTDAMDGEFNGMSHAGVRLLIRNVGPDCTLPALPSIRLRDARGRVLPAARRAPVGMHPGPVMVPVRLAAGHRARADLRWVSGAVFTRSRSVRSAAVTVTFGAATVRAPLKAVLYGEVGAPVAFEQTPFRAAEGMAAG